MNTKQKQWQLYYLGYYGDDLKDIDVLWGLKDEAVKALFELYGVNYEK